MKNASCSHVVRAMSAGDVDEVLRIARSHPQAPQWQPEAYLHALEPAAQPQRMALVAEDRSTGALDGFLVAAILPPQAELELIAVAPSAVRRGIARLLFAELAANLRARPITELLLEVRASNRPATSLYRALGCEEQGRRPRYYADPLEDALLFALPLRR